MTYEKWVCGKCGFPEIMVDNDLPVVGVRCSECNYVHMFAKTKEFQCETLQKDRW